MRLRAARLIVGAAAWILLGVAAVFLVRSEKYIERSSAAVRALDRQAREATDALADLRFAQQAYVAAGQGVAFWLPKVASTTEAVRTTITSLRQSAASGPARSALMEAEATIAEFETVDKRARDYINSDDHLMAADVIFAEGGQTATAAARQVERARLAEHQALDAAEAVTRKQQALALGLSAGLVALIIALLVPAPLADEAARDQPELTIAPAPIAPQPHVTSSRTAPILRTAAEMSTELGRVRDLNDLKRILGRAAEVLDASGLVVWIGGTDGADLQPIVSHGYTPQVVARMPSVPRSADNAAAAAYRTGSLQIVLSRPGGGPGALVAPILAAGGCIGALSAEIRGGGEGSDSVQSLAAILAAHLAGVFAAPAADSGATQAAAQG